MIADPSSIVQAEGNGDAGPSPAPGTDSQPEWECMSFECIVQGDSGSPFNGKIMDYEKKYNEALERAKKFEEKYGGGYAEYIFPELAESEDERIRKFLKDYAIEMIAGLESDISISVYDGVKGHDPDAEEELEKWRGARAWLEKQKEPENTSASTMAPSCWQKEQKPADLSEMMVHKEPYIAPIPTPMVADEQKPVECEDCAMYLSGNCIHPNGKCENVKSKQECSEDDEKDMAHIIRILDDCYAYGRHDLSKTDHENLVNKLKSLRPQYHGDVTMTEAYKMGLEAGKASSWKPSEEQMSYLLSLHQGGEEQKPLRELIEQLKKLM